jgi:CheY-specific phosphatase CheX
MTTEAQRLETMLGSIAEHAKHYLADEMAIAVVDIRKAIDGIHTLMLENLTAVIGIGGPSGVLVAFSYSAEMSNALFQRTAAALEIPAGEEEIYLHATLSETANVILGNALPSSTPNGGDVAMTPPAILEGAKRIHHMENAVFGSVSITTAQGSLNIYVVGPRDMFRHYLDVAK